jgi:hypothetical protein
VRKIPQTIHYGSRDDLGAAVIMGRRNVVQLGGNAAPGPLATSSPASSSAHEKSGSPMSTVNTPIGNYRRTCTDKIDRSKTRKRGGADSLLYLAGVLVSPQEVEALKMAAYNSCLGRIFRRRLWNFEETFAPLAGLALAWGSRPKRKGSSDLGFQSNGQSSCSALTLWTRRGCGFGAVPSPQHRGEFKTSVIRQIRERRNALSWT